MAKAQYTRNELFILRNHIPVDSLIEKLGIPSKMSEGYFRFCCPVCCECDTGVNPATNLARCFRCERNYNTIDLVMLVKRSDFIHSVKFLKNIYEQKNKPATPSALTIKSFPIQPVSVGHVLKAMEPALKEPTKAPPRNAKHKLTVEKLDDRVRQLEQQISRLAKNIKTIEQNL
jgi:hypothetical protein